MRVLKFFLSAPGFKWRMVSQAVLEEMRDSCLTGRCMDRVEFLRVWETDDWDYELWWDGKLRDVQAGVRASVFMAPDGCTKRYRIDPRRLHASSPEAITG